MLAAHLRVALTTLPRKTKEDDKQLRALVGQGASIFRAAAAMKRRIPAVRNRARKLGCPFPTIRGPQEVDKRRPRYSLTVV